MMFTGSPMTSLPVWTLSLFQPNISPTGRPVASGTTGTRAKSRASSATRKASGARRKRCDTSGVLSTLTWASNSTTAERATPASGNT